MRFGYSLIVGAALLLGAMPADVHAQKKSRDKLTNAEIMESAFKDQDLLTAIRGLKPQFLEAPRGVRTIGGGMQYPLVIYIDGRKAPGLDAVFSIRAQDVHEVKYLDPTKSQNEYGITANGGALQVKLIQRAISEEKKPG